MPAPTHRTDPGPSVCNLGGTFPRVFVLRLVDGFTSATCTAKPGAIAKIDPFSCAMQADKERCDTLGGLCHVDRDGYYMVNIICVIFGAVTFAMYIRPKVLQLQALPLRAWRLATKAAGPVK